MNAQEQRVASLHAQARADYLRGKEDGTHERMAKNARRVYESSPDLAVALNSRYSRYFLAILGW